MNMIFEHENNNKVDLPFGSPPRSCGGEAGPPHFLCCRQLAVVTTAALPAPRYCGGRALVNNAG